MGANSNIEWCAATKFRASGHGPRPYSPRDGDAQQARQRINVLVRTGKIERPNSLPCVDCGHAWIEGERRHEYDHHHGYGAAHHYCVEPVCTLCHAQRDSAKANQTHCIHGHEFTTENTHYPKDGGRACRACMKIYERRRGPRGSEHWRKVNKTRREARRGC